MASTATSEFGHGGQSSGVGGTSTSAPEQGLPEQGLPERGLPQQQTPALRTSTRDIAAGVASGPPSTGATNPTGATSSSRALEKSALTKPAAGAAQPRVVIGSAADHAAVETLLQGIFHGPSPGEFHSQLEDPFYEPNDRVLVKRGKAIVAHARCVKREMLFDGLRLPVAEVVDVATLPEYRKQGYASALLQQLQRQLAGDGTVLSLLKTRFPQFFLNRGWVVCPRHSYSVAGPRDILAHLSAGAPAQRRAVDQLTGDSERPPLNIRLWRHVEQAALHRLYEQNTNSAFGAYVRSEAYWRWLISRRGYDRIYVAIEGSTKLELDDQLHPIVGYAAMIHGRIAELMTSPERPDAASHLLHRACADAIERDDHRVHLDAPPDHPLHAIMVAAGGEHRTHEVDNGLVQMAKVTDPKALLQRLCPLLVLRARAAGLNLPCELGVLWNDDKSRIVLSRRSAKLVDGKLGRSYLTCRSAELVQLLLGHLDVDEATENGRIEFSTGVAQQIVAQLFPRLPFSRPTLDDLPALNG